MAFVSTIYGVGLANLLFYPIANKLKNIVTQQVHQMDIAAAVFHDIAGGDLILPAGLRLTPQVAAPRGSGAMRPKTRRWPFCRLRA